MKTESFSSRDTGLQTHNEISIYGDIVPSIVSSSVFPRWDQMVASSLTDSMSIIENYLPHSGLSKSYKTLF